MSTSKEEGNVEGDLARASVEKENSSPPPTTMTLPGPQSTNPPHSLLLARGMSSRYLSSNVSYCLLPLSKFDIKRDLRAFDSLVSKVEGNVDVDLSTDNDDNNSPPNKKQRKLPMPGESTKYTFASEDDLHKMTHSNLLNGLDTCICTSCKVDMSSLVVPCQICNSYIPFVPLQIDEFQIWVKEQQEKAKVAMMKSPSKEEKVVDMKAAAQQSRGATWQP